MARKYDLISELYRRTAHAVVSDVQNSSTPKDRTQRRYWKSSAGTINSGVG